MPYPTWAAGRKVTAAQLGNDLRECGPETAATLQAA